jgi:hypothetical protein
MQNQIQEAQKVKTLGNLEFAWDMSRLAFGFGLCLIAPFIKIALLIGVIFFYLR